jgi:hypothetical protein
MWAVAPTEGETMIYSIQLFGDQYEEVYCGCWFVACPFGDPRAAELELAGYGMFLDDAGNRQRAFFVEAELDEQLEKARRVTDCYAKACPARSVARAIA